MRRSEVRPEITADAVVEARRRLRPVPEEERRYSVRSNFGRPPERYGQFPFPPVPPRRHPQNPNSTTPQAQHEQSSLNQSSYNASSSANYSHGEETPRRPVPPNRRSLTNGEFNAPALNSTNPFSPNYQPNGVPQTSTPWSARSAQEPSPPLPFQYVSSNDSATFGGATAVAHHSRNPPAAIAHHSRNPPEAIAHHSRNPPALPPQSTSRYVGASHGSPPNYRRTTGRYSPTTENYRPVTASYRSLQTTTNDYRPTIDNYRPTNGSLTGNYRPTPSSLPGNYPTTTPNFWSSPEKQQAASLLPPRSPEMQMPKAYFDEEYAAGKRHLDMLASVNNFFESRPTQGILPMPLHQQPPAYGGMPAATTNANPWQHATIPKANQWQETANGQDVRQPDRHVHFLNQAPFLQPKQDRSSWRQSCEQQQQQQQPQQQSYNRTPPRAFTNPFADPMTRLLEEQHRQQRVILSRQSHSSKLPTFGGNPLDWPLFSQHYLRSTKDCQYTAAENCDRLEKALTGDAKELVRPLLYTRNNPDQIMEELESRYGRPDFIIAELTRKARLAKAPKSDDLSTILQFSSAVNNLVITIESLQMPAYLHNPQLLQEFVEKLPASLKLDWGYASYRNPMRTLRDFANWVKVVADAASRVSLPTFNSTSSDNKDKKHGPKSPKSPRVSFSLATAEVIKEDKPKVPCQDCGLTNHRLSQCRKFREKEVDDRWEIVKKHGLCFQCLGRFHKREKCQGRRCPLPNCHVRHHSLLHGSTVNARSQEQQQDENTTGPVARQFNGNTNHPTTSTLLRIVPVKIVGRFGSRVINAVLDDASHVTLLDAAIAKEIGIEGREDPLRLLWTNGRSQVDQLSRRCVMKIGPSHASDTFQIEDVRTVSALNLPQQNIAYKAMTCMYPYLRGITFSYLPNESPKMLIGEAHIHLTMPRDIRERGEKEPVATRTKLGWILHGPQQTRPTNAQLTGNSRSINASLPSTNASLPSTNASLPSTNAGLPTTTGSLPPNYTMMVHEVADEQLHQLVKESFTLECIGIRASSDVRSREDVEAEKRAIAMTRRVGDRFETGVLWRDEELCEADPPTDMTPRFPPSRDNAFRRMLSLERKMKKDPLLQQQVNEKISHYLESGYIRKLSKEELAKPSAVEWYLPLFTTTHPNKPGKIRLVWDAAAKSKGKCFNDFVFTGADRLNSLVVILVKGRQRAIAFSGDIVEMFHQFLMRKQDRAAQRFLHRLKPTLEPGVYEIDVMFFGSAFAPFLAQFIRDLNATEHAVEFPAAADAIHHKHFMDDYHDCKDTVDEASQIINDVTVVHAGGGLRIAKWISNSQDLMATIPEEKRASSMKDLSKWSEIPTERLLGLYWDTAKDVYTFRVNVERAGPGIASGEVLPTKRAILRLVMLIYDPLGFLSHYTIKARILLQRIWRNQLGWDDTITPEMEDSWKRFIAKLPEIAKLEIPRCYSLLPTNAAIRYLHVFADASESAYCAAAYLVSKHDGIVHTSLVMGKSRVAPLKPKSIPRLELQAALCAARLRKFIDETLDLPIESYYLWTDSMTVLRWLRNDARRYQQFVANRIGDIHEISDVSRWRWIPTEHNVADEGTRDGRCNLDSNSRWFNGPEFLKHDESQWPFEEPANPGNDEDAELRGEHVLLAVEPPAVVSCIPDTERFSRYMRLLRATATTLKAIQWFKGNKTAYFPVNRAEDLLILKSQWEHYSNEMQCLVSNQPISKRSPLFQLSPFKDPSGIMRMDSRLAHVEEINLRQPVFLHPKAHLTHLIVLDIHEQFGHAGPSLTHNEVRQRFWIPTGKTAIKSIIRTCGHCLLGKAKILSPIMGALPEIRTQQQLRPFTVVGIDYFGPFWVNVKRSTEPRYGVLFTCLTTRAVHLEIAHGLDTDKCIMTIHRFIGRRGQPQQLLSDNGKNFVGADRELKESLRQLDQTRLRHECEVKGIEWHFSCPRAPHMTGAIERLVGSVKRALKAIMKKRATSDEVLLTFFCQAEAIVNSRPLTDVSSDPSFPEALTPFHFLIGTSSVLQPPGVFDEGEADLGRRWRRSQALTEMFWNRWRREYLPTLQKRTKWHEKQPNVEVGEVVILFDESLARDRRFPLGIVTATFPGENDGVVRVVEVKTSTGTYRRPTVRLGRLGICSFTG